MYTAEYGYDANNNITKISHFSFGSGITQYHTYGKDNLPTKYTTSLGANIDYTYDGLNRLTKQTVNSSTPVVTSWTYEDSKNRTGKTTGIVSKETIGGLTYRYTRDNIGNITKIEEATNGVTFTAKAYYTYDSNSQLTWESNAYTNITRAYTCTGGNITKVDEWDSFMSTPSTAAPDRTINYGYQTDGWKDKMTSYDGDAITYDEMGNPLTYRDGMTMTWEGRSLKRLVSNDKTLTFRYDADGF